MQATTTIKRILTIAHCLLPILGELAAHLTGAFDYVAAHPERCEANTVIMYAWNEHSEGGFLCPSGRGTGLQSRDAPD
jgi:hypothetical protein